MAHLVDARPAAEPVPRLREAAGWRPELLDIGADDLPMRTNGRNGTFDLHQLRVNSSYAIKQFLLLKREHNGHRERVRRLDGGGTRA